VARLLNNKRRAPLNPDHCFFRTTHPVVHRKPGRALRSIVLFVAAACLAIAAGIGSSLRAQRPAQTSQAHSYHSGKLRFVVVLSRHGVRSPTGTNARLDTYSTQPWPVWSVPPGYLTERGFELIKRFAGYNRAALAQADLLTASGCGDAPLIYIWTDQDERTKESGRAFAEGMFPGCPPATHGLANRDPLFHPGNGTRTHAEGTATQPAASTALDPDALRDELMNEMQHVLLGCPPRGACTPSRLPDQKLMSGSAASEDNHAHTTERQLGQASSFAEDFLLEYVEGMPASQVGWGHVDAAQIRRFMTLHEDDYLLTNRNPAHARREASNMLFHIVRTLEQAAEQQPVAEAVGPVGSKMVILVGHDSNLAAVAELLGLHWTLDGRADDTPPGMELVFELWQDSHGAFSVRITAASQTLRQMREMRDLTLEAPPAHQTLTLKGCPADGHACRWSDFQSIAETAIDTKAVHLQESGRP
jgi:4-phytase / acid phosphatase